MIGELRISTAIEGELDDFIHWFQTEALRMHGEAGIEITNVWVDRERNQLIWVRAFADEADMEAKLAKFLEIRSQKYTGISPHQATADARKVELLYDPIRLKS